ncbi:MAG: hypothetical protein GY716_14360 [bacterium]|nr:hypothetical protein [bacterium]
MAEKINPDDLEKMAGGAGEYGAMRREVKGSRVEGIMDLRKKADEREDPDHDKRPDGLRDLDR